jgi:hypothetical protein
VNTPGGVASARKNPCASCPYRRDCPSGVWHADEYAILLHFDGPVAQQALSAHGCGIFYCHQSDGMLCAGWAGHREPYDILAIRLGVASGRVSPSVLGYRTSVPLFATGAQAAAHGMRDYVQPPLETVRAVAKIIRVRALCGSPVDSDNLEGGAHEQET